MPNETIIQSLVGMRGAIGTGAWLAPKLSGRLFGLDPAANPQAPYLGRLFAVRDAALAFGLRRAAVASERSGCGSGSRVTSPTQPPGCLPDAEVSCRAGRRSS